MPSLRESRTKQDDRFEWDDEKARKNLAKHYVSFESATAVFDDPNVIDILDFNEVDEERWVSTGLSASRVLVVVWTERHENRIRIISARKANRDEEDRYYRQTLPQE